MRDAHGLLLRALTALADPPPVMRLGRCEAWCSATFTGARHHYEFFMTDEVDSRHFAMALPDAEFRLPGHIVADIGVVSRTVTADGATLVVEALTVEDG